MVSRIGLITVLALSLLVAACGSNPGDRAITGAGLGAAGGAAIGAFFGVPAIGAAAGAAAGGAAGAATTPAQVDLGKPVWE
jgi:osmotically inducible lipoprotein OsmB